MSRDRGEVTVASVVIAARNAEATLGRDAGRARGAGLRRRVRGDRRRRRLRRCDAPRSPTAQRARGRGRRRRTALGPGPARNRGVAAASGAALAFIDADCVPTAGWLEAGVAALAEAELVQGAVRADPAARRRARSTARSGSPPRPACTSARACSSPRELFDRLGGFEDWLEARIGKPLAEDAWFGWRARRAGAPIALQPSRRSSSHAVFRPRALAEFVGERAAAASTSRRSCARCPSCGGRCCSRAPSSTGAPPPSICGARRRVGRSRRSRAAAACSLRRCPGLAHGRRARAAWGRRAPAVAAAEARPTRSRASRLSPARSARDAWSSSADALVVAMRVLTVGNMYPPHHLGGYELMWRSSVEHLRAVGHEVDGPDHRPPRGRARPGDRRGRRACTASCAGTGATTTSRGSGCASGWRSSATTSACSTRHARARARPDASAGGRWAGCRCRCSSARGAPASRRSASWSTTGWPTGPQVDGWQRAARRLGPLAAARREALSGIPARFELERAARWLFASADDRARARSRPRARGRAPPRSSMAGSTTERFRRRPSGPWSGAAALPRADRPAQGVLETAVRALAELPEATPR